MDEARNAVQKMWSDIVAKPRGSNKDLQKRAVVYAWRRGPAFKETFFAFVEKVAAAASVRREAQWLAQNRLRT
eukprot:8437851-Alexandrium_andersonii.AAC.1